MLTHLTFLSIKTSGTRPHRDRVVEISWLKEVDRTVTETFSSWIDPGGYVSIESLRSQGIHKSQLLGQPAFPQIAKQLVLALEDGVVSYLDAKKIVVKGKDEHTYTLINFLRNNNFAVFQSS